MATKKIVAFLYGVGIVVPIFGIPVLLLARIIDAIHKHNESKKKKYEESIKGLIKI